MSSTTTKVMAKNATLSYPHLDVPQAPPNGGAGKAKYSCALVFPPGADRRELEAAVQAAAEVKWPGKGAEMLRKKTAKSPFREDAESKGYPEGSMFMNVRSEQKPGCVYSHPGPDGKTPAPVDVEDVKTVFYAGCKVNATLRAFAYDNSGNKGVSFALNNLQKVGEGERLDGRRAAADEFDADLSAAPADLSSLGL